MNHAFSKIWIIIILLVFAGGGIFAWQYFRVHKEEANIPKIEMPEEIVSQFYQGYLKATNCGPRKGCALEAKEYIKLSNDLEKDYKEWLLKEEVRLVDPVLWASDVPPEDNLQVSSAIFKGNTALVDVTFLPIWPNHKLRVSLSLVNNEWKISNIEDVSEEIISDETADWKTYRNEEYGFEIKYPENFGANVWRPLFWSPRTTVVSINEDPVKKGCPDFPIGIQGATENKVRINNIDYTFYRGSEGAMGSSYTNYCYVTQKGQNYYIVYFVIRSATGCGNNCGAYCGTPYETECINLDRTKDIEKPIEKIISTFRFLESRIMTYFIILESITIFLAFLANIGVFYLLIKLFNRSVKFSTALKLILLYEAGFFVFWIIDPSRLLYFFSLGLRAILYPVYLLASVVVLSLFLYFLMRKFSLLNFKKTLTVFLIIFFIVTPFLSYYRATLAYSMTKSFFPDIASELPIFNEMIKAFTFQALPPPAKAIKILNIVDDSFLGGKFFKELRWFIMTI